MGTTAVDRTDIPARTASVVPTHDTGGVDIACRVMDIVIAGLLLIILSPVMLLIALAIRIDSGGPVLFRQRRLGLSLEPFMVLKFRTMKQDASHDVHREFIQNLIAGDEPAQVEGKPRFKLAADDRVTRVGCILRRTSLDELPQLWNALRGEMSLVGPRPPIPYEVEHYPAHWFKRFAVKPGLTGLWQVSGRCELTMEQMISLDIEYIERRSVWLNAWILLRTIPAVLTLRGAS